MWMFTRPSSYVSDHFQFIKMTSGSIFWKHNRRSGDIHKIPFGMNKAKHEPVSLNECNRLQGKLLPPPGKRWTGPGTWCHRIIRSHLTLLSAFKEKKCQLHTPNKLKEKSKLSACPKAEEPPGGEKCCLAAVCWFPFTDLNLQMSWWLQRHTPNESKCEEPSCSINQNHMEGRARELRTAAGLPATSSAAAPLRPTAPATDLSRKKNSLKCQRRG